MESKEIGQMITDRIALYNEIVDKVDTNTTSKEGFIAIFQEVCKDDRQSKIPARSASGGGDWKDKPASKDQVNLMLKLKIAPGKYTQGEASELIEEKIQANKKAKETGNEGSTPSGWG